MRIKSAVDSGELGKMLLLRSNTRDPPQKVAGWADPKVSGGIFLDTSSHDYDVIRWLSGSEAVSVVADGVTAAYPELEGLGDKDTTMTIIRLANGALAHVDACRVSVYGYDIRAEVIGTEGAAFMDIGKSSEAHVMKKSWESNEFSYWYTERFDEAYRGELEGFAGRDHRRHHPQSDREGRAGRPSRSGWRRGRRWRRGGPSRSPWCEPASTSYSVGFDRRRAGRQVPLHRVRERPALLRALA